MSKYKVGDELRIREWDDMVSEFGMSSWGNIMCKNSFNEEMRYLCGNEFTVSKIINGDYFSVENIERTRQHEEYWHISEDMLEPRTEEDLYVASDNELNSLLNI